MKAKIFLSMLVINSLIIQICPAQDDVKSEITPAAIDARIAEIRMGDMIIKTKPGATVKIQQVRHEFKFGTEIGNGIVETEKDTYSPEDRKMYLKTLAENFNFA